jgi:hypothetical protein
VRKWNGGDPVWLETAPLADLRAALMTQADTEADAIIGERIGRKEKEYTDAYADAAAYRDAGFAGTVPDTVADYAEVKGWTPEDAAQDVLNTGDAWLTASRLIRKNRLACKEAARTAATPADIAAARSAWAGFRAAIRTELGLPPAP